jgi:GTP cyclohydrolase I
MSANVLAYLHLHGKPDRAEVEAAVRTIIRWSGDNPDREGLIETLARVTRAFEETFVGYIQDPAAILQKSFDEIEDYDEMIVLRGIPSKAIASITWHRSWEGRGSLTRRMAAWSASANSSALLKSLPNVYKSRKTHSPNCQHYRQCT